MNRFHTQRNGLAITQLRSYLEHRKRVVQFTPLILDLAPRQ